jgi:hypothetical protein
MRVNSSYLACWLSVPAVVVGALTNHEAASMVFFVVSSVVGVLSSLRLLFPLPWRAVELRLARCLIRDVDGTRVVEALGLTHGSSVASYTEQTDYSDQIRMGPV